MLNKEINSIEPSPSVRVPCSKLKIFENMTCNLKEPVSVDRWQHGSKCFFNFYLIKKSPNANKSATTEAREKINRDLKSL
jgi:hypothetical protein